MWPFSSSQTLLSSGVFKGFVDCHSHIIPGVDDGIKTLEHSLEVLSYFEELGFSEVWCTSHIMEDLSNTPERLRERFNILKDRYEGPITLRLSAEHMLDYQFEKRLAAGDVLPYGPEEDMLLVETSYFNSPSNMDHLLSKVRSAGFFPVLAHPERYEYMGLDEYKRYYDEGIRFQLNLLSLTGNYGPAARKKAEWMLKREMYMFKGTDIHSLSMFQSCIKEPIRIKCR